MMPQIPKRKKHNFVDFSPRIELSPLPATSREGISQKYNDVVL